MKYQELVGHMLTHNVKLEEQFGELLAEDQVEAENIDNSLEWWTDYLAQKYVADTAQANACKELAAKYLERAKSFENSAEYRKQGLFTLVNLAGKTIKTAAATVYKSKSVPTVDIYDEAAVPAEFTKQTVSIDKKAINDAVKNGLTGNWFVVRDGKEFVVVKV